MVKVTKKAVNHHQVRANSFSVTCSQRGIMVYFTIRDSKEELFFSTGIRVTGKLDKANFSIHNNVEATNLLQDLKNRFYSEYYKLELAGLKVNLQRLKALVFNESGVLNVPTLFECLENFYTENYLKLEGKGYKKGTVVKFRTMTDSIKKYFVSAYQTEKLQLSEVRKIDGQNLINFCKSKLNHQHNHAIRHVEMFKRILNYAVDNQWIDKNPLGSLKTKRGRKPVEAMTEEELETLINAKLEVPQYEYVKDAYLLACFTGLSYMDVRDFAIERIKTRKDGQKVYDPNRGKNENRSFIPLIPQALELIERYKNHPFCVKRGRALPVFSNAYMNRILKEIMVITGIQTLLKTHTARKTCSSYFLNNGVPIQSVSAMLGHKSITTTERFYFQRSDDSVVKDFQNFIERKKGTK
ncbi:site-specific integrase [Runella salmonicolor]|uniref:Site-specific integrase n=1 Tax=Runella salmonicolor TaxID=2950278 RepID=A0ABT1FU83_9BACT|nr:site-specific integrase [Runella salmonicolor]MCP1384047.1 site-specific integrase [Runella salmonicolor]